MKKIIILGLGLGILVSACKKNTLHSVDAVDTGDQAKLKVLYMGAWAKNPNYQIKVNGDRVSPLITRYDTPFPGGGYNTGGSSTSDYLSIKPGATTVSITVPKVGTSDDSVQLASATVNLDGGKKYSLYFADTAANTINVLVEDNLSAPDSGFVKYRFINLTPDMPFADLYVGTVKVASNVPYGKISSEFTLPTNNSSSTWNVRTAGGTTNLGTYAGTVAGTLQNQRVYTVIARGYNSISAAENRKRNVSLVLNK